MYGIDQEISTENFLLWVDDILMLRKLRISADFNQSWGCRSRDHMVVGFTTTYAISAYHH